MMTGGLVNRLGCWSSVIPLVFTAGLSCAKDCSESKTLYLQALDASNSSQRLALLNRSLDQCESYEAFFAKGETLELQERWNDAAYAYKRAFEEKHTLSEATASAEQEQDALGRAAVAFARAGNGCNADLTFRQAKGLRPGGSSASVEKGHRDFLAAQSQRVIGADEIFCVLTQSKDIGVEPVIELHNIHFDFDSDKLRNGEQAQVDELSKGLSMVVEKDPGARFKLVGHTDERGTAKHNMDLSWRRASTIERALAERQPSLAVRLDTDGRGKEEPLVRQAQSEDDHQLNRRVEIHRE